jgi:enamine deaminase RidA (YjgF/YER057c/UK114 family)
MVITTEEVNQRLQDLGITLSKGAQTPTANYVACVKCGNLLYISGHNPLRENGTLLEGRLGDDLTVEQGYEAARLCAVQILSTLHQELRGDWSKIVRLVKLLGFVQSTAEFHQQPLVINGASDLFIQVFGEHARSARSAVGMIALPWNIATEVECIVELLGE